MQISQINNYQNTPNFTAFKVKGGGKSLDRVMETFNELSTSKLIDSWTIIKKEAKNPAPVNIEDLGYLFGQPMNGHWEATIGDKIYTNGNPNTRSAYSLTHFLQKLSNKNQKLNPVKMSERDKKVFDYTNKAEKLVVKHNLKMGQNEQAVRDKILDHIFELIRK